MTLSFSRRKVLGAAAAVAAAGAAKVLPAHAAGIAIKPAIDVYTAAIYYGWYDCFDASHNWQTLCPLQPAAGSYTSFVRPGAQPKYVTDNVSRQLTELGDIAGCNLLFVDWSPTVGAYQDWQLTNVLLPAIRARIAAGKSGLQFIPQFSNWVIAGKKVTPSDVVNTIRWWLDNRATDPLHLRWTDANNVSRPVIAVWYGGMLGMDQGGNMTSDDWDWIWAALKADKTRPLPILLGNYARIGTSEIAHAASNPIWSNAFYAEYDYNMNIYTEGSSQAHLQAILGQLMPQRIRHQLSTGTGYSGGTICLTTSPGYNDAPNRGTAGATGTDYYGGATMQMNAAATTSAVRGLLGGTVSTTGFQPLRRIVTILGTYNEWKEGTAVESSVQYKTQWLQYAGAMNSAVRQMAA